jgi:hypothetical protein
MKAWLDMVDERHVVGGIFVWAITVVLLLGWHGCNNVLRSECLKEHHPPAVCAELP